MWVVTEKEPAVGDPHPGMRRQRIDRGRHDHGRHRADDLTVELGHDLSFRKALQVRSDLRRIEHDIVLDEVRVGLAIERDHTFDVCGSR